MRENNEKMQKETDAAIAFATFLLNILIILVLCGTGWILHLLLSPPNSFRILLSESVWR